MIAAREPQLSRRYAELHEETLRLADGLEQLLRADGLTTALPSRGVAEILITNLIDSFVEQFVAAGYAPPDWPIPTYG